MRRKIYSDGRVGNWEYTGDEKVEEVPVTFSPSSINTKSVGNHTVTFHATRGSESATPKKATVTVKKRREESQHKFIYQNLSDKELFKMFELQIYLVDDKNKKVADIDIDDCKITSPNLKKNPANGKHTIAFSISCTYKNKKYSANVTGFQVVTKFVDGMPDITGMTEGQAKKAIKDIDKKKKIKFKAGDEDDFDAWQKKGKGVSRTYSNSLRLNRVMIQEPKAGDKLKGDVTAILTSNEVMNHWKKGSKMKSSGSTSLYIDQNGKAHEHVIPTVNTCIS